MRRPLRVAGVRGHHLKLDRHEGHAVGCKSIKISSTRVQRKTARRASVPGTQLHLHRRVGRVLELIRHN